MPRYAAVSKIGNSLISLLWQLRCLCNPDHNKFSSSSNTTVVAIFPKLCLWRRSLCSNLGGIDPEKLYRATLSLLLLSPPSLWASSPGVPRGTGVGEGKGEGELALASHKIEYLRPRIGCEMLIGWFLIRQWCYVPVGELAYRLRGKTPLLAWNLSNLSPFCPTARSPQENFPAGYSPPCFERFFSEWVFLKNHHIYFAMLAVNQNGR